MLCFYGIGCIFMKFPRCVSQGQKLKETLLPSLNLLIESSRIHRETRKFLRSKVITGIIQLISLSSIMIPVLTLHVINVCVCVACRCCPHFVMWGIGLRLGMPSETNWFVWWHTWILTSKTLLLNSCLFSAKKMVRYEPAGFRPLHNLVYPTKSKCDISRGFIGSRMHYGFQAACS